MSDGETRDFDLIIVGAGPAGLFAAMYAGRGMLNAVTLERGAPGGELLNTDLIEDYPGFASVKGWELAQQMADHAQKFGARIDTATVDQVARTGDDRFTVTTIGGPTYRAPAVILTAGGTPIKLGIPGEKEYAGKGVSYCAVCDGAFFKGEVLAVVGGGDAAVEEAEYLTRYASKVYIVHRSPRVPGVQDRAGSRVRQSENRSHLEHGSPRDRRRGKVCSTSCSRTSTRANAPRFSVGGVFIFIGFKPNTGLVAEHAGHDSGGYL